MQLAEIEAVQGEILNTNRSIGEAAIQLFNNQFQEDTFNQDFSTLECILKLITKEETVCMISLPKKDEVKQAIFELNDNSVVGPDDFSGLFFQKW